MSLNQNVTQEISLTGDALGHEFGCQDYAHVKLIGVVLAKKSWLDGLVTSNAELIDALEALILFSKHQKTNAVALNNAYQVLAKAKGEK